jgi:hypothetical protein
MSEQSIQHIAFSGTRMRFDSELAFDAVLQNLRSHVGRPTASELVRLTAEPSTKAEFTSKVERCIGDSEFMLFLELDHGAWMDKFAIKRKVIRWILGNPLIAITMIRHDVSAGLFVPVELLLVENENGNGSSITYVLPSSLMVIDDNPDLLKAARELDAKFEKLVANAARTRPN